MDQFYCEGAEARQILIDTLDDKIGDVSDWVTSGIVYRYRIAPTFNHAHVIDYIEWRWYHIPAPKI